MRVPVRPAQGAGSMPIALEAEATSYTGLRADLLIPGRGEPVKNGALIIQDDKISWVGGYDELPSKYSAVKFAHVPVLMPGMWDCHVHYTGIGLALGLPGTGSGPSLLPGAMALASAVIVADLKRTLDAGFTSVRELAGYAGWLWPGIRDGYLVGPTVYSSINALSITGGHGDEHDVPLCAVKQSPSSEICDGVDECLRAVRTLVRNGARCIKVCSSGGVLSLDDDPEDQQFSDAELAAIVGEASRTGRTVAAHAIGKAGILSALRAGAKSIEHGCYLDEEVAEVMKSQGAILVATRHIQETILKDHGDFPPKIREKIEKIVPLTRKNYALAVSLGVKIALGTDTFESRVDHALSHGKNGIELVHAVNAGMSALQAIEACTATAPEVLGAKAPKSGQLKEGYDADVIALVDNPLNDISLLASSENVTHVWKGGKVFKSP